ncbi:MAG TPA: hypothetical protein VFB12_11710 [Ktedonobacteraceae bacterium]|nr:hypothetical protein [Ktedonobacteraceae bacterium]
MSLTMTPPAPPLTIPGWVNRVIIWLLRSPLHPLMSRTTMVLTVTGQQSKRRYTIPVRYLQEGNTLITTTYRPRLWWRNLRGGAPVSLFLAGNELAGRADVSTNSEEVEQGLRAILLQMPRDASIYHVRLDRHGQPDTANLKQVAQVTVLITIHV